MNASQLFADIETGAVVEVETAANHFYSEVRALTVRQQFFVYPDDSIVALNSVDGGYEVVELTCDDDVATFKHRNPMYFQ